MFLNSDEIQQFLHLLPAEGNLKALELTESIIKKLRASEFQITEAKEQNDIEVEIKFTDDELKFIQNAVSILDSYGKLKFQSLSLIRKIRGI